MLSRWIQGVQQKHSNSSSKYEEEVFYSEQSELHDEFDCLSEIGHAPSVGVNLLRLCKYLCLIFQSHQYHNYHARHLEGNFKSGVYIK